MEEILSKQILILTNNNELAEAISETLSTLQYTVDTEKNTLEAIQKAERKKYLLILASEEPAENIDTLEFYKILLRKIPHYVRRVIFVTDNKSREYLDVIRRSGCHYINKPYNPADLTSELAIMRTKKIITETRLENRYSWKGKCVLIGKNRYTGETMDISSNGARVQYAGEKVTEGSEITVTIPDISYYGKAHVRWNFEIGNENMMGLDLETALEPINLKKAIPFA